MKFLNLKKKYTVFLPRKISPIFNAYENNRVNRFLKFFNVTLSTRAMCEIAIFSFFFFFYRKSNMISDADRDVRRAVPAVRRLLRAERDAAVRVQRQARGVRAQREHEPVREVRAGAGGERDLRLGGAAHQGGDRGGRQARRRRVGRRGGRRARGRRWPPAQSQGRRRLGRRVRRRAPVRRGRAGRNAAVPEPVRRDHGRRLGRVQDVRPEERRGQRATEKAVRSHRRPRENRRRGRRQVHRAQGLLAFGQLFSRTAAARERIRRSGGGFRFASVRRLRTRVAVDGKSKIAPPQVLRAERPITHPSHRAQRSWIVTGDWDRFSFFFLQINVLVSCRFRRRGYHHFSPLKSIRFQFSSFFRSGFRFQTS